MIAVKTPNSNHNFGPPSNVTDGSIGDLPCQKTEQDGLNVVRSIWEPSEDERAAIAAGMNIELDVVWIGAFPPVSLNVTDELSISALADKDAPPPITAALRVGSDRSKEAFVELLDVRLAEVRTGMLESYRNVHALREQGAA